jgi:hypothetical protein
MSIWLVNYIRASTIFGNPAPLTGYLILTRHLWIQTTWVVSLMFSIPKYICMLLKKNARMNSIFYYDHKLFFLFFLFQFCYFKSLLNLSPKKLQFFHFIYFSIFTFVTKFVKLLTWCKNLTPQKNADHNYCNEAILVTKLVWCFSFTH